MPNIEVRGRYRAFTYDGTTSLDFTTYANNLCVIRRPNEISFRTLRQYIPAVNPIFTTFEPGSAYVIITRGNDASFDIGPYTRVDRLPSTLNIKDPLYYLGLDKNSITIPLSVYALSVNNPISAVTGITYVNGVGVGQSSVQVEQIKEGFQTSFTHFLPNSGYQLRNRIPFTFFAPLQSEMGDAWATGYNQTGQLGMGYQYDSFGYTQLYGTWDKVVMSSTHAAALSTCGTKKKLFVCGSNNYAQLGLTPVVGYTTQRAVTAIQTAWTEVKNLYYYVWDPTCEGGCYFEDALTNETIQDVEVGDYFTLVKTDQYLYGIGNMYALGIAPPGDPSCCPQFENSFSNTDPSTNYYSNTFLKYFTRFLNRSTPTLFLATNTTIDDQALYNEIQSSRLQKFQARGPRWWALYDNKLYACGKIGGTGASLRTSYVPVIPMGLTVGSTSYNTTFREIFALNNSTNWTKTYTDFEASRSTVVALSSDNKRWLIGGAVSYLSYNTSLSTMSFYDSQQNSYVPQNDYGLRLFPTIYGAMGIKDGILYFTPNTVNTQNGGSYIFGLGSNKTITDMPSSSLPKINTALSPNPDEQVSIRSLVPVRYINSNSPNVSWKSLFVGFSYSCATDINNKFYICGSNSVGQLGLQQFPSGEISIVYTLSNVIPDNVYNVNASDNNVVIYKTNRNPAPSFTPLPSMTPTPTPTPVNLVPSDAPNAIFVSNYNSINSNLGDRAWWMRSTDAYNTATVSPYWAFLNGSRQGGNPYWLTRSVFDFKDNNNVVVGTFGKTGTLFNTFKHIVKNISTWDVTSGMNDVVTAGTTVATWNDASQSSPYYQNTVAGGNWPVGHVDMFVHRNSNTAVYVFTQFGGVADNSQTYPAYGPKGAWSFTVDLANNAVGSTTTITSKNLCFNRYNSNCAYYYYADPITMPKVSRPLRKLPDGTVIFKSMYLDSYNPSFPGYLLGANYGAVALIGRYDTPTWDGFTSSVEYVIPNSADTPDKGTSNLPAWTEFAKLGNTYYLAWCTKTISDAQGIGGGYQSGYRTQANLVLRNLQSETQVQVDTGLNTSTSTPFSNYGNLRMQPYDIIGEPRFNRIYVAYTKYTSYTGNPDSRTNVLGIFLKRYDQNLNLIDNTQLFSYTTDGDFGPALVCPVFSYYVDANKVLKLILAFGSNSAGSVGGVGTVTGDYIFTNTPSIDNTWTQVFNRSGSNASRVMMALGAGNNVISI